MASTRAALRCSSLASLAETTLDTAVGRLMEDRVNVTV